MPLWQLTNSEAGWITASFYGAYMVSVPVFVTLTDRVDPKRVYHFGVAATVFGHMTFALFDGQAAGAGQKGRAMVPATTCCCS